MKYGENRGQCHQKTITIFQARNEETEAADIVRALDVANA